MRFIGGFVFFGLLFYAIWLFFPEAFTTLVSWAAQVFNFFIDLWHSLFGTGAIPHKEPTP